MKHWDEIRTVARVARYGNISAAARELKVHRATVARHVDALEEALGLRLFRRHQQGYAPTEAALELLQLTERTERELEQIARAGRMSDRSAAGDVRVTATGYVVDVIARSQIRLLSTAPDVRLTYLITEEVLDLATDKVDIAVRIGERPDTPDYVVQHLCEVSVGLYASAEYIARHGQPTGVGDFGRHYFAGPISDHPKAVVLKWLRAHVPEERMIIRSGDVVALERAVLRGAAIGFMPKHIADGTGRMREIIAPSVDWSVSIWLVTHRDAHRSRRIQVCVDAIKDITDELKQTNGDADRGAF